MKTMQPGWYADPDPSSATDSSERYWDGQSWSHQVRPTAGPAEPGAPYPGQPYQAPNSDAATPDGQPLASWWTRAGATAIDVLVLVPVLLVAALPSLVTHRGSIGDWWSHGVHDGPFGREQVSEAGATPAVFDPTTRPGLILALILLAVAVAYYVYFLHTRQASPGKIVLGLQVRLRDRPGPLSWSTIAFRVALTLPLIGAIVLPGVGIWLVLVAAIDSLWAAWDPKGQSLHDKAAGTNVIRTRALKIQSDSTAR